MKILSDQNIIHSWRTNAKPWIRAISRGEIESRILVTNNAIINTILAQEPKSVLGVGCGEGWLVRELCKTGVQALGIDAAPELIAHAQAAGEGRYRTIGYEELSSGDLAEKFDVVVCNFSLLGYESVNRVFEQVPLMLTKLGSLIVQTIHPETDNREKYCDGWRESSLEGFNDQFTGPAPWYFRTLDTWKTLLQKQDLIINEILEPLNPKTNTPASIIFVGLKAY